MNKTKNDNTANKPRKKPGAKQRIKRKKQRNEKKPNDIQKELLNIYKEEGKLPDMSKLDKINKSKIKTFLLILLFILAILATAAWAGFFIFGGLNKFSPSNIKISIEAPEEISSGEEITYTIKYKNEEQTPISRVIIDLRYPDGFIFEEANPKPTDEKNSSWSLSTLTSGQEGKIKIKGKLLGNINTDKTIRAFFNYRPGNFNSDFREETSFNTKITSSIIEIKREENGQIIAEESTNLKFILINSYKKTVPYLRIIALWPQEFTPKKEEETDRLEKDNIWNIKNLQPQKEEVIEIIGSFDSAEKQEQELILKIEISENGETWYLQHEKKFNIQVLKGEVLANLIINGSAEDQTINFGQTLNYSIVYQNKGQTEAKDLRIKAILLGNLIDWSSLEDDNSGQAENGNITWDQEQISELALLKPGEEGTIDFRLTTKNRNDFAENESIDNALQNSVEITIGQVGESENSKTVTSSLIKTELNSDLSLLSQGKYFNDDNIALGSGPLPPRVGQTTNYRIFWILNNSVHEVSDLKIKTVLPHNVFWTGKSVVEAGELNFDVNTREIVWRINRLPTTIRKLEANFEISITPEPKDINTVLTLLPETTLEATDKITGDQLFLAAGAITSNLEGDPIAAGKGLVAE